MVMTYEIIIVKQPKSLCPYFDTCGTSEIHCENCCINCFDCWCQDDLYDENACCKFTENKMKESYCTLCCCYNMFYDCLFTRMRQRGISYVFCCGNCCGNYCGFYSSEHFDRSHKQTCTERHPIKIKLKDECIRY